MTDFHPGQKHDDSVRHMERAAASGSASASGNLPSGKSRDSDSDRNVNHSHDNEKHAAAADVAEAQHFAAGWVDGTREEKKLVRKLDWRILPCTWVLYMLGFLDRANVG